MISYYKLNGDGSTTPTDDMLEAWDSDRRIRRETVQAFERPWGLARLLRGGKPYEADVSTVFLVVDHSFGFGGRPMLFETMVFGGPYDQECERTSTIEEACAVHARVVVALRNGRNPWGDV